MTAGKILTDREISQVLSQKHLLACPDNITVYDVAAARAIEQAVLQSPEIQRLKNIETIAKEVVSMSDGDGNYLVLTADIDRLRAAMEKQK